MIAVKTNPVIEVTPIIITSPIIKKVHGYIAPILYLQLDASRAPFALAR